LSTLINGLLVVTKHNLGFDNAVLLTRIADKLKIHFGEDRVSDAAYFSLKTFKNSRKYYIISFNGVLLSLRREWAPNEIFDVSFADPNSFDKLIKILCR